MDEQNTAIFSQAKRSQMWSSSHLPDVRVGAVNLADQRAYSLSPHGLQSEKSALSLSFERLFCRFYVLRGPGGTDGSVRVGIRPEEFAVDAGLRSYS